MPYEATQSPVGVHLYRAQVQYHVHHAHRALGWELVALGGVQIHPCPGDHYSMLRHPNVQALADAINFDLRCVTGLTSSQARQRRDLTVAS